MSKTYEQELDRFHAAGQGHVFAFWDELDAAGREQLLSDAAEIDLTELGGLVDTLVLGSGGKAMDLTGLEPAPYIPHPRKSGDASRWAAARAVGEAALRNGEVAAFTVAGGQGTRLGYDGPKGTFPVTPVRQRCLFAVFADKLIAAGERYGRSIPWFIMTSQINHAATLAAFEANGFFGMDPANVMFFSQGRMPAVDYAGKILLAEKAAIALSPDGHGGSLRALVRSGAVARMQQSGIRALSYFQVDNPLVQVIDPAFIGFHLAAGSEMSSKMIPKAYPLEKVGHFCILDGRNVVVEYSDLPNAMQEARTADGGLRFPAGSIAIHILDVGFVARVGSGEGGLALPFHRAEKKIQTLDAAGAVIHPAQPNGIKFEMFVFDALPFARNPVIIETLREDDFSPVKNASGVDSAESCRADQLRQWCRWLHVAGELLPTDASGLPEIVFEIAPTFADSEEQFVAKWAAMVNKPALADGCVLC